VAAAAAAGTEGGGGGGEPGGGGWKCALEGGGEVRSEGALGAGAKGKGRAKGQFLPAVSVVRAAASRASNRTQWL
jgi:hypothetical protein